MFQILNFQFVYFYYNKPEKKGKKKNNNVLLKEFISNLSSITPIKKKY